MSALRFDLRSEPESHQLGELLGGNRIRGQEYGQRIGELGSGLIAVGGARGQRLDDHIVKSGRHGRGELRWRHHDRGEQTGEGGSVPLGIHGAAVLEHGPEKLPRQKLPEHDAKDVEIGSPVRRLVFELLGREVSRLAQQASLHRLRRFVLPLREAEVEQLHLARKSDPNVRRVDVPVDQAEVLEVVGIGEALGNLVDDVDPQRHRHLDSLRAHPADKFRQIPPVDEALGDERFAVDFSGSESIDQIGM